ncbi:MAG: hypothetical protein A4E72_00401 [Syntrophus sp. PtaU1.Bin208]|nr:MAG: hypothetical protein A4E72_00401 [Syntrophus sp. PtaU1.Bin208]
MAGLLNTKGERKDIIGRDFLAGVVVSSLVFLLAAAFPFSGSFLFFLAPLPIIFYYSKVGRLLGLLMVAVTLSGVVAALKAMGSVEYAPLFGLLGFLGVAIAEVLRRKFSIEQSILASLVAMSIPVLSLIAFSIFRTGEAPWWIAEPYLVQTILANAKLYGEMGVPAEQISLIRDNAPQIARLFINILPALSLISITLCIWLNMLAARAIFYRQRLYFPDFGDLARWKAPEKLVWIVIGSGGALLIPDDTAFYVGLNILLLCLFVYLLQGLAIVSYFFRTRNIPILLRSIFYVLLIFQQALVLLVIAFGLFDLWFDFRKFNKTMNGSTV